MFKLFHNINQNTNNKIYAMNPCYFIYILMRSKLVTTCFERKRERKPENFVAAYFIRYPKEA